MYMLVWFIAVFQVRKNHDFSSHMVIIRPSFYIINDAFSEFVAITIFLLEGLSQFYTPFHFLEKELLYFPFLIVVVVY